MCYCGDPGDGEYWLAPIRQMGPVVMEQVGVMPYPVVQSIEDDANIGWTRQLWQDLRPHMSASVYVNEPVDEDVNRHRLTCTPGSRGCIMPPTL